MTSGSSSASAGRQAALEFATEDYIKEILCKDQESLSSFGSDTEQVQVPPRKRKIAGKEVPVQMQRHQNLCLRLSYETQPEAPFRASGRR